MRDTYDLKRGETVGLNSIWNAVLVKQDDKWRLVSSSGSANAFDNDVIRLYFGEARNRLAGLAGILGLVLGAAVSWGVTRRSRRARTDVAS